MARRPRPRGRCIRAHGTAVSEPAITSTRNPRLRAALGLRDRRERDGPGSPSSTARVRRCGRSRPASPWRRSSCAATLVHGEAGSALLTRLGTHPGRRLEAPEVVEIGRAAHDRLAYGERGDGVVAVARAAQRTLAQLGLSATPLVAVLAAVEKPGNLGAILRSADGAGVDAVLVADAAHRSLQPQHDPRQPGHPLQRAHRRRARTGGPGVARATHGLQVVVARVDAVVVVHARRLPRRRRRSCWAARRAASVKPGRAAGVTAVHLPMLGLADSLNGGRRRGRAVLRGASPARSGGALGAGDAARRRVAAVPVTRATLRAFTALTERSSAPTAVQRPRASGCKPAAAGEREGRSRAVRVAPDSAPRGRSDDRRRSGGTGMTGPRRAGRTSRWYHDPVRPLDERGVWSSGRRTWPMHRHAQGVRAPDGRGRHLPALAGGGRVRPRRRGQSRRPGRRRS